MENQPKHTGLGFLLQLEKLARRAETISALHFIVVNETIKLIPFRQAVLWDAQKNKIAAVSGTPSPNADTPYVRWSLKVSRELSQNCDPTPRIVTNEDISENLIQDRMKIMPAYLLWVPLQNGQSIKMGGMLLARNEPWSESELTLISFLAETYAHAWDALSRKSRIKITAGFSDILRQRFIPILSVTFLMASFFIRVPLTALGNAEVAPLDPAIMRSPLDGVIDQVLIEPNSDVKEGQLLVRLEKQSLESRLLQAEKNRDVEQVKLLKASQSVFGDMGFSGQIDIIKAAVKEREAEIAYIRGLLERTEISAPFTGIAIFDEKTALVGKPVKTGEKILSVARKGQSKLVVWLSTKDAISLEPGARISMFLNVAPERPLQATLTGAAYIPSPRPEGYMAYRVEAAFDAEEEIPRVGLRGVAKIYGQEVTLAYYLFRRPLTSLRQWSGL